MPSPLRNSMFSKRQCSEASGSSPRTASRPPPASITLLPAGATPIMRRGRLMSRSLLPNPVKVPAPSRIVSPLVLPSMAAWIVGKSPLPSAWTT